MDRAEYLNRLHARFAVSPEDLAGVVRRATGGTVAATWRLIRGDENEVHRVELADGPVVYVRVSFPGTPLSKLRDEAWAIGRARDGGVPAPEVLATETIETADGRRTAMVMREAAGRQLHGVLPSLDREARSAVMTEVGRVLKVLHSVSLPGVHGVDPAARHREYVEDCLTACERLPAAGLTPAEVRRVADLLEHSADGVAGDPVLCHGDVSPEHVFVDGELRVTGLIDWGMWRAGPAESELAGLTLTTPPDDLDAIMTGHGDVRTDPALHRAIAWHAIAQATGEIAWLVSSGQGAETARPAAGLRRALAAFVG